jgi:hypothetical protein
MRARYDKGHEPTMAAEDELPTTPHRSHGGEAGAAAHESAAPIARTER